MSGSRAGGAGGGTEPKRFDRWYTPNWRERAETDRAVFRNGLAAFAIVATEFREYMETEYGVPMTMDDAVSFVDTHGLKEYNE